MLKYYIRNVGCCFENQIDNLSAYWTDPQLVEDSHPPLFETLRERLYGCAEGTNPGGSMYAFVWKQGVNLHTYIKTTDGQQAINSLSLLMSGCIHRMSGLGVHDTVDLCCLIKCNQNTTIVFNSSEEDKMHDRSLREQRGKYCLKGWW